MAEHAPGYYAYLLRMWRTGPQGPWRASLEDAETGERIGFGSLAEAFGYLRAKAHGPMADRDDVALRGGSIYACTPLDVDTHSRAKEADDEQDPQEFGTQARER